MPVAFKAPPTPSALKTRSRHKSGKKYWGQRHNRQAQITPVYNMLRPDWQILWHNVLQNVAASRTLYDVSCPILSRETLDLHTTRCELALLAQW